MAGEEFSRFPNDNPADYHRGFLGCVCMDAGGPSGTPHPGKESFLLGVSLIE